MEKSREGFFLEAQKLGITPEMAVSILRRNNVKGNYSVEKHDEYLKMLNDYVKCLARLMDQVNKIERVYHLDDCPICGSKVERDSKRDGSLGEQIAWKCTNPEQGLVSHFIQHRLERIRPWMQRNQGMSDREVSLKMNKCLTESPSGASQKENSSVGSLELSPETFGLQDQRESLSVIGISN